MTDSIDFELGCRMPIADWVRLNRTDVFRDSGLQKYVSPFPPPNLMQIVSTLVSEQEFAGHGADIYVALSEAATKPLSEFRSILDFGCGCGRLARMFKGHPYHVTGCDIDRRHVEWINASLDFMGAKVSSVNPPIPYANDEFEAIISISIFSHLNEKSQDDFLGELFRVAAPDGRLFLTVHGERALARAVNEPAIRAMINVPDDGFAATRAAFAAGKHAFILQFGQLTTLRREKQSLFQRLWSKMSTKPFPGKVISEPFEYGITFIPESYIRKHWVQWFEILDYRAGALHDWQDVVVLKPRKQGEILS